MSFDPEKITFFAKTDARGQQVPFGIKAKDRQRHMYVVGKTGMGKSTLLENMAAQDIMNGEGVAFIDPHGSAAQTLLDYVPEHRINDVIYFAPFDMDNPISFNVMEDVGPDKRHLVVSGLMSTFKKIWVDAWSARMEYILTNALLALIEYPDTTLLSVNRLFSDKAYRARVVDYIKDPAVKAFWVEEFAGYTDRFAAEALPAIQNKIGQFTGNPLIRNIIGQPHSSFDIRKIMDEKKILIMNLSKGLVGETNANLLGSMLTTRIYLGAMSRADLPVAEMRNMPNFYFYVDEFQSFANSTFANILSEARKYHLNLIIAHQYIEQMEEDVRSAVFGNVGTTISFRVGPFDAEVLETVFTPRFVAADLVNLGFAQIYLTLMIDGIGSQPFSAVTLPPVEKPRITCTDMVISASRRNYTKTREEVEKLIVDLHTPVKIETPIKKIGTSNNVDYKKKEIVRTISKDTSVDLKSKIVKVEVEKIPKTNNETVVKKPTINHQGDLEKKPQVPPKSERSLSELKNILGQISDNGKINKGTNNTVSVSTVDGKVGVEADGVSIAKDKTNNSDLQNVLSSLLKKTEGANKVNLGEVNDNNKNSIANIASTSVNIFKPKLVGHLEDKNFPPEDKDKVRNELEKMSAEVEALFVDLNIPETNKVKSETFVNANSSLQSKTSHKQHHSHQSKFSPKPQNNHFHIHQKNNKHHSQSKNKDSSDSPLSPKKIEKKLRQPQGERSPFTS